MRRGDREVSSGEVCSSKRVEAVNPVPKSHQGALTVDRWRRSSAPRRSGQLRRRSDLTSAASRVFVCATEIGATSPNLTYWLSPNRIYIQSRGEEGTEEKEGRTNHEYPVANEIWSGSIPCVRRNCPWPKEWNKWRERDRELVRARVSLCWDSLWMRSYPVKHKKWHIPLHCAARGGHFLAQMATEVSLYAKFIKAFININLVQKLKYCLNGMWKEIKDTSSDIVQEAFKYLFVSQ